VSVERERNCLYIQDAMSVNSGKKSF